ncbi:MAG: Ig-like domain-containing protein, partial [Candidatus Nitrosomaritimum yanchengensis]
SGMKNTLSLQIQDSNGNPIFANKDTEFRIAADDNSVEIPQTITIKKGDHVTFFDIIPKQPVVTEISVLASDFPLSKFKINTIETTPSLIISTVNSISSGEVFDLVLDAKLLDLPLSNVKINWDIQGAEIQKISEITDEKGKIKVTLVSQDTENITVKATTDEFDQISVTKEITLIKPGEISQVVLENKENPIENNLGFILIPGVVIGSGILLRKRSLLEPLAERFPVIENALDRIDEIFERLAISEKIESIKEKIPIIKER